jgi:CRP/FNR family transcriptional regulator, dissimilatory nitrate respiration regulator
MAPGERLVGLQPQVVADLAACPIYSKLTVGQLERLASLTRSIDMGPEVVVFRQADPADAFYLVSDGKVKVCKVLQGAPPATIGYARPGETFGESALFTDEHLASVETLQRTRLCRIDAAGYRQLMLNEPAFAIPMLALMARQLWMMTARVEELLLPVPARLARFLLDASTEQESADGCRLTVAKRELAARLGTVPETLSRTLRRLTAARVISNDYDEVTFLDRPALQRLAQL